VQANIPTYFDKGTINNIEDYEWNEKKQRVDISFKYTSPVLDLNGQACLGETQEIRQRGTISNTWGTEWALSIKFVVFLPLPIKYLVLAVDEEISGDDDSLFEVDLTNDINGVPYTSCMIGVPDRSSLWIMNRTPDEMSESTLALYTLKAQMLGSDVSKIVRVPIVGAIEETKRI
jgi:lipocalin